MFESGFTDTVAICARVFVVWLWRFPFAPSASGEDYGFLCATYTHAGGAGAGAEADDEAWGCGMWYVGWIP